MPAPSMFMVGPTPVFLSVDDNETLTVIPVGGSLYYRTAQDVNPGNGTLVADGAAVVFTTDVWVMAPVPVRLNVVSGTFSLTNFDSSGRLKVPNGQFFTTASAGGGGAPPATVQGYFQITIQGTAYKVPYYLA